MNHISKIETDDATACDDRATSVGNPNRIRELTNATALDEGATLIEISNAPLSGGGAQRYRVTLPATGEELIARSRDPEHEACRALQARGITGRIVVCRQGGNLVCMRFDIGRGSQRTVSEGVQAGPRSTKWAPFDLSKGIGGDGNNTE